MRRQRRPALRLGTATALWREYEGRVLRLLFRSRPDRGPLVRGELGLVVRSSLAGAVQEQNERVGARGVVVVRHEQPVTHCFPGRRVRVAQLAELVHDRRDVLALHIDRVGGAGTTVGGRDLDRDPRRADAHPDGVRLTARGGTAGDRDADGCGVGDGGHDADNGDVAVDVDGVLGQRRREGGREFAARPRRKQNRQAAQ